MSVTALLTAVLAAFSGLWTGGALLIDGPGIALYVRLATDYLTAIGRVPYWVPEMWSGAPVWALAPSLPAMMLVPVASIFGPAVAVKVAILAFQVIGGVGAYVLARSIWGRTPANLVAALVYTLHPFVISHGPLAGAETASGVLAAVPWLVWTLRLGLRGEGTRYVVGAGFLAAFAVIHQAELAYGLVILCVVLVVGEVGRLRAHRVDGAAAQAVRPGRGRGGARPRPVRPLAAAVPAAGQVVHPVAPGAGGGRAVQRHRGHRRPGDRDLLHPGQLPHGHDQLHPRRHPVRLLLPGLGVRGGVDRVPRPHQPAGRRADAGRRCCWCRWWACGCRPRPCPWRRAGPPSRHQWVGLGLAGAAAGLALGAYLRRLGLHPRGRVVAVVGGLALLGILPFVTPFLSLQTFVPLVSSLRFPRFYVVAPLGLALGTAYPIVHLTREGLRRPRLRIVPPAVLAGVIAVAFMVDVLPYRSFYRLNPPADDAAYAQMTESLKSVGGDARIATGTIDPRSITAVMDTGRHLSVGWPHPLAGVHNWRLSGEAYVAPFGYREASYGLSSTGYLAVEEVTNRGTADEAVSGIRLIRNPRILPLVRTYDQAVVVADANVAPLLATSLASRNVATVDEIPDPERRLNGMPVASVPGATPCRSESMADLGPLAGEMAVACALDPWIGAFFAGSTPAADGGARDRRHLPGPHQRPAGDGGVARRQPGAGRAGPLRAGRRRPHARPRAGPQPGGGRRRVRPHHLHLRPDPRLGRQAVRLPGHAAPPARPTSRPTWSPGPPGATPPAT